MAIPALRFASLDKEFNVPVTSISESDPTKIINSASNDISGLTIDILSAISSLSKDLNLARDLNRLVSLKNRAENALGINKLLNAINSAESGFRSAKGIIKSTIGGNLLFAKNINSIISRIFHSDPTLQNIIRTLNLEQNNKLIGNTTIGRPYRPVSRLPTGSLPPPGTMLPVSIGDSSYNYPQIVQAISKLSSDNYTPVPIDKNALVQQMVIVGNLGYEANLTGVMKALSSIPNATPDVIMRATSIIMLEQSTSGNAAAILDMSAGVNSVVITDNAPLHQAPSIISDTFTNFKLPIGTVSNNLSNLVDVITTTASALDTNWNSSDYDGTLSAKYFTVVSKDLENIMKAKVNDNIFSEDELEMAFNNSEQDLYCAIAAIDSNSIIALNALNDNQGNCCLRISSMCC